MKNKANTRVNFEHFVSKFPEIELPVVLNEDSQLDFSRDNEALHPREIHAYISKDMLEDNAYDEIVPCFRFPDTPGIIALVFWHASILNYRYILKTYDQNGESIDVKTLGGLLVDQTNILRRVVHIDTDWTIHMVEGQEAEDGAFDSARHKVRQMELLASGQIISLNENT